MPPNFYSKPKRTLIIDLKIRRRRNCIFDVLNGNSKGIAVQRVQNHACETDNDRYDYS